MLILVPPAVRVLSPARAPRGLHRALFMNSVSHGKIWTNNAASLWNSPVFLRRASWCGVCPENHPSPPPPPSPTLFFQRLIKGYNLCLRGGQLGGGGGGVARPGQVKLHFCHKGLSLPHPKPMVRYRMVFGQRGCFRVQVMYLKHKWVWVLSSNLKISCNSLFKRRVPPK